MGPLRRISWIGAIIAVTALTQGPAEGLKKPIAFGKVVDATTGHPIVGVHVLAIYSGQSGLPRRYNVSPGVAEVATDTTGRYTLSVWGQAWVLYSADEYESARFVYPEQLVECDSCCGQLKDVRLQRSR